jgi:hypothetical protein
MHRNVQAGPRTAPASHGEYDRGSGAAHEQLHAAHHRCRYAQLGMLLAAKPALRALRAPCPSAIAEAVGAGCRLLDVDGRHSA